jgi:hypothetical protein
VTSLEFVSMLEDVKHMLEVMATRYGAAADR